MVAALAGCREWQLLPVRIYIDKSGRASAAAGVVNLAVEFVVLFGRRMCFPVLKKAHTAFLLCPALPCLAYDFMNEKLTRLLTWDDVCRAYEFLVSSRFVSQKIC